MADWLAAITQAEDRRYVLTPNGWTGPEDRTLRRLRDEFDLRLYPGMSAAVEPPGSAAARAAVAAVGGELELAPWGSDADADADTIN